MPIRCKFKKRKKSVADTRITLDAQHKKKMLEFEKLRKSLPQMKKKLDRLQKQQDREEKKYFFNDSKSYTLHEEITKLKEEIDAIETGRMEREYFAKISHVLNEYYDNFKEVSQRSLHFKKNTQPKESQANLGEMKGKEKKSQPKKKTSFPANKSATKKIHSLSIVPSNQPKKKKNKVYTSTLISDFINKKEKSNRATLLEKYNKLVYPKKFKPTQTIKKIEIDLCPRCDVEMILEQSQGMIVCNQCGRIEYIVIDSEKPSYKDPPPEAGEFTYKRANRLEEWLSQYQANETTEIPQDVLDMILLEVKKEKIRNMCCLSIEKVKGYLKKLKLNKYYEHVPHIIYCLTGMTTPRFSQKLIEKLRWMFRQIQGVFDIVCPPDRTNFLSYSYILGKCLELLGEDEHKKYFRFHKNREKIAQHDRVWKKICHLLQWEYIRSV